MIFCEPHVIFIDLSCLSFVIACPAWLRIFWRRKSVRPPPVSFQFEIAYFHTPNTIVLVILGAVGNKAGRPELQLFTGAFTLQLIWTVFVLQQAKAVFLHSTDSFWIVVVVVVVVVVAIVVVAIVVVVVYAHSVIELFFLKGASRWTL